MPAAATVGRVVDLAVLPDAPAFALLHRPRSNHPDRVEVLLGEAQPFERLADLPLPALRPGRSGPDVLLLLPYRQLAERGLACVDDGTPAVALTVAAHDTVHIGQILAGLPDSVPVLHDARFEPDDGTYGALVRRVLADEIGRGAGSNFVVRRSFLATVDDAGPRTALAVFRRLLLAERGAYWTFVVHGYGRTLVGASPERHVSLAGGVATMNPVSGTYRYPAGGPTVPDLARFLADRKETEELYMVVDEELKMLGRICDDGARLHGPRLIEMAHLAHTEYTVAGGTRLDVRDVLRETMFAPTVIGSPLPNACRVVARHEGRGRGYYGGAVALIGQRDGQRVLDSAIAIRTADLTADGGLELGVGATLVRRSDPAAEVAETRAKARGLLAAIGAAPHRGDPAPHRGDPAPHRGDPAPHRADPAPRLAAHPRVRRALAARNANLARFWLAGSGRPRPVAGLAARRVLVVDAGDAFTVLLAHQLRALGPEVTVRGYRDVPRPADFDVVVVGPGPGDPNAVSDPKIAALRGLTTGLLVDGVPVLSICLGHQVLAALLGLPVRRRPQPAQGEQRTIDLFGWTEQVSFYNTFAAYAGVDRLWTPAGPVELCRERDTGEVYAIRAPRIRGVQFHPESVLTRRGTAILHELLTSVLDVPAGGPVPARSGPVARSGRADV